MNKEVLVIEDNEDNLKIITYVLKRAGFEVTAPPEPAKRGSDLP